MNNLCRITYDTPGSPLSVVLTEASIRTTCNLSTYEPAFSEEIPFDRQSLAFKTIMRGSWLSDAINELASTSPETLTLVARMVDSKPYFALSSTGDLGSARVEFNNTPSSNANPSRSAPPFRPPPTNPADAPPPTLVLETFTLSSASPSFTASYKFSLIQKAARAMSVASKVSVRADTQGVLSLQFMIEVEAGKVSFVDFRFVPLVEEGEEGDEEEDVNMADGSHNEDGNSEED
jgi:cell cycle checkpoint protein